MIEYKVSADIRRVPLGGGVKNWGCRRRQFLAIWVATSSQTSETRPAIFIYGDMLPLVGLRLIAKRVI